MVGDSLMRGKGKDHALEHEKKEEEKASQHRKIDRK